MVKAFQKAIESQYIGVCEVFENKEVKDLVSKITKPQFVKVSGDHPCRVSYASKSSAVSGEGYSIAKQVIKLFISPTICIKPGSRIEVTQHGKKTLFRSSGNPSIYSCHQEVTLEIFGERA